MNLSMTHQGRFSGAYRVTTTLDFDRYVAILQSLWSDGRRTQERRRNPRVGTRIRVQIIPVTVNDQGLVPGDIWLRDLSRTGIGFATRTPIAARTHFMLLLPKPNELPILVPYRVSNARRVSDGLHTIGAVAVQPDEFDRLREAFTMIRSRLRATLCTPEQVIELAGVHV